MIVTTHLMRRMLLLLAALFVGGCATVAVLQGASRMQRLQAAQNSGDAATVLALAREEIASPTVADPLYAARLRVIAMGAQSNVAYKHGFDEQTDAEFARYLAEGTTLAGNDAALRAQLRITAANYYGSTRRPGRSLPLLMQDLQYQRAVGDVYQQARALDGIALAYGAMGEAALRDAYRAEALRVAAPHFAAGSAATPSQWLNYGAFLEHALGDAADRRDVARMDVLWPQLERVALDHVTPASASYVNTAKLYVVAGAFDRADALTVKGSAQAALDRIDASPQRAAFQADLACLKAMGAAARRERGAGQDATRCEAALKALREDPHSGTLMQIGLGHEAAGDDARAAVAFDGAIRLLESVRGSFSVAERAAFFSNNAVRRAYWGRIRVAARAAGDSPAGFFDALARAEATRARQLGELTGGDSAVGGDALQAYARRLPESEAVVSIVVMDDVSWVAAFNRQEQRAAFVPLGRGALEARVRDLLALLGSPGSDARRIERLLASLSSDLLAPVEGLLKGRSRLTFVPDGAVALLPPGLLSLDRAGYKPLGLTSEVMVTPAVRFLLRSTGEGDVRESRDALWALADPVYPGRVPTLADAAVAGRPVAASRGRLRSVADGGLEIAPLPETRLEVQGIARLFDARASQLNLGRDATKARLLKADLNRFAYLHFATHGVLAGEVPGLGEPALVLAADAQPEDAFLRASEAEALRLNATVTVLSACSTGSGLVQSGEGVMSLSRSFLVAGSRHVLMSLWPVDSAATSELMLDFYRNHRSGKPLAAALRAAMQQMQARRPHPMYWAPFVLVRG